MAFHDDQDALAHLQAAARFEVAIKDLKIPPKGIPARPLAPPCRPDLETDDLPESFEGAFDGQAMAPDWTLVHGYLAGKSRKEREAYAWLEHAQLQVVYDIELDELYLAADYAAARSAVTLARYTADQALEMRERHPDEPYGPWFEEASPASWAGQQPGLQ